MNEARQFGLPIHVSELDASLKRGGRMPDLRPRAQRREQQSARVAELAEAFMDLPPAQRFAFTVWGVRDSDSGCAGARTTTARTAPCYSMTQAGPIPCSTC